MPELPEVESVRRSLRSVIGRRVERVEVYETRLRRPVTVDLAGQLVGRRIDGIDRHAKYLVFRLSDASCLVVHLGMSGTLRAQPTEGPRRLHDHIRLWLSGGGLLTFNDPRRFGLFRVASPAELSELVRVGPDPLDDMFTVATLAALLRGRSKPIKNLLMDQRALGGIGNIYASEILFRAGIRPSRQARRVTRREHARLFAAIREVLRSAIDLGGSSISDYRDGDGRSGSFQLRLAVYDRAGELCPVCHTAVRRTVHAGRGTFYCPCCQR